jgi:hypothetical protein
MNLTPEQKIAVAEMLKTLEPGFSGYSVCREFNAKNVTGRFAPRYDWHEFSNLLDVLNSRGIVKVVGYGRDGETKYAIA